MVKLFIRKRYVAGLDMYQAVIISGSESKRKRTIRDDLRGPLHCIIDFLIHCGHPIAHDFSGGEILIDFSWLSESVEDEQKEQEEKKIKVSFIKEDTYQSHKVTAITTKNDSKETTTTIFTIVDPISTIIHFLTAQNEKFFKESKSIRIIFEK